MGGWKKLNDINFKISVQLFIFFKFWELEKDEPRLKLTYIDINEKARVTTQLLIKTIYLMYASVGLGFIEYNTHLSMIK